MPQITDIQAQPRFNQIQNEPNEFGNTRARIASMFRDIWDTMFNTKQDKLVSGQNIRPINGQSMLGSTNLVIEGGSGGSVDVAYQELAYEFPETTWAYDPAHPHKYINITNHLTLNLTGVSNGKSGILAITKSNDAQNVALTPGIVKGDFDGKAGIQEFVSFQNVNGTIVWFVENPNKTVYRATTTATQQVIQLLNMDGSHRGFIGINEGNARMTISTISTLRVDANILEASATLHSMKYLRVQPNSASSRASHFHGLSGQTGDIISFGASSSDYGGWGSITPFGWVPKKVTTEIRDLEASTKPIKEGNVVYNTNKKKLEVWNGTAYETITSVIQ
jgi:hypothetical protein